MSTATGTATRRAPRTGGGRRPVGLSVVTVLVALVPLAFLTVFFVLPVLGMVARGFLPEGHLDLNGAVEALGSRRVRRVLWLTLAQSVLGTGLSVALGLPAAYTLYRLRFPGRELVRAIVTVPFVLPTVVVGVAFRTLLNDSGPLGALHLDGSWAAIIAGLVFFNISLVVRTVGTAWAGLDRRAEDAAAALGATPRQVLMTVTLPALWPAILSVASVVFLFCATAFGVVLTLGGLRYGTIETEIYLQTAHFLDLSTAAVLSVLQLVVIGGLLAVVARVRGRTGGRSLGHRAEGGRPPRRGDLPALTATALVVLFLLAPMVSLVLRSLRRDGAWTLANYRALQGTGDGTALIAPASDALRMSLVVALNATVLAVVLGLLVALVVSRPAATAAGRRARTLFDGAFMLPLGVSAVTVGFGFLITLDRPPLDLRSSSVLVPIAQATVALPLVVRTVTPALTAIDDRLRQAAGVLGASPWRALVTVDLPVLWRPLLAATGLAMAVSMGEFGATAFLARADQPTLPVVIFRLLGRPGAENFGMAMAASVILAGVSVALMSLTERLDRRGTGIA